MLKIAHQGIIICSYDNINTLKFFHDGLTKTLSEEDTPIPITAIYGNPRTTLPEFIASQIHSSSTENKIISNIYGEYQIPSFELLNHTRGYYTKINQPIIFWFYEPLIEVLFRLSPDFMRVRIGFFQFRHSDTNEHSIFFESNIPSSPSRDEIKLDQVRKTILSSYLTKNLNDLKNIFEQINYMLSSRANEKDVLDLAIELVRINHLEILPEIDFIVRRLCKNKGQDSRDEDRKFIAFCKKFAENCKKMKRDDLAERYLKDASIIENEIKNSSALFPQDVFKKIFGRSSKH